MKLVIRISRYLTFPESNTILQMPLSLHSERVGELRENTGVIRAGYSLTIVDTNGAWKLVGTFYGEIKLCVIYKNLKK